MDLLRIPAVLAELWDDLPRLVGPPWTELFPKVAAASTRLAGASEAERPRAVLDLAQLFRPYPRVSAVFREALVESRRRGGGDPLPGSWEEVARDLLHQIDGPIVRRYVEVFATRLLAVGERGLVAVDLTAAPASPRAQPAELAGRRQVDVHALAGGVGAAGVTIDGDGVRRITIAPDGTTEMAAFGLHAVAQGDHPLRLDLRQGGRLLATVSMVITVAASREGAAGTEPQPDRLAPTPVQIGGSYVPPPDLDLRVMVETRGGQTILRYVLHSPNGAADHHYEPAGEVVLRGSPNDQQERLLHRIEQLASVEAGEKLRAFGERLYRELLPPELRRAYGRFRGTVRSLQITSDEPWIPWELVRPFDDAMQPAVDDDFWAVQFDLARWLAGSTPASARIDVERLACVEAATPPGLGSLPAAAGEHQRLSALAARHGVTDASPSVADRASLHTLLVDPSVQLWHFASHGDLNPTHPDEAALVLADGNLWRAEDLHGARQAAVAKARPLVMLNACRVGRQGWSLTRLGGWAEAWVRRCRCGAFIGPQWSVSDTAAAAFARAFYGHAERGHTLAAAVRAAREEIRTAFPDDPTWLAYSLYAHPNAQVRFGPPNPTDPTGRPDL